MSIRIVYIDVLFLLNLVINYLLLIASARMTGAVIQRKRIAAGAAIGALYAVVMFFPQLRLLYTVAFKLLFAIPITAVSFSIKSIRQLIKYSLIFFAVSFVFAGCVVAVYYISNSSNIRVNNGIMYMNIPFWMLVISVMTAYILIGIVMRKSAGGEEKRFAEIEVAAFSGDAKLKALYDSGNELTDPMTNKRIIVAEYGKIKSIFPQQARDILDTCDLLDGAEAVESVSAICRLRVVPYKTVGNENALMAVFKPDRITVDGKSRDDMLVGISSVKLSDEYDAVVNL